jgi:hypothetical protein
MSTHVVQHLQTLQQPLQHPQVSNRQQDAERKREAFEREVGDRERQLNEANLRRVPSVEEERNEARTQVLSLRKERLMGRLPVDGKGQPLTADGVTPSDGDSMEAVKATTPRAAAPPRCCLQPGQADQHPAAAARPMMDIIGSDQWGEGDGPSASVSVGPQPGRAPPQGLPLLRQRGGGETLR